MNSEVVTNEQAHFNDDVNNKKLDQIEMKNKEYKVKLVWRNVILMTVLHVAAVYGLYIAMFKAQVKTLYFMLFVAYLSSMGIQCGAHRLWAHRTYKAKLPLKILLAICHIIALENDVFEWSRDHRVHHKYSETDADPHNAKRGFFFSHVGWLLCRKHPDVIEKGKSIDMSDLENDPVVKFQRRFYIPLVLLFWGFLPTYIPVYFWGETKWNAYFTCVILRYVIILNITWLINSVAHLPAWGMQPYDQSINPVESKLRHLMFGEGFHNYHHTFPWDYSASEFGFVDSFNPATAFIDLFAWIGWAYDLRKASPEVIKGRQNRNGNPKFEKSSKLFEYSTAVLTIALVASPFILGVYLRPTIQN